MVGREDKVLSLVRWWMTVFPTCTSFWRPEKRQVLFLPPSPLSFACSPSLSFFSPICLSFQCLLLPFSLCYLSFPLPTLPFFTLFTGYFRHQLLINSQSCSVVWLRRPLAYGLSFCGPRILICKWACHCSVVGGSNNLALRQHLAQALQLVLWFGRLRVGFGASGLAGSPALPPTSCVALGKWLDLSVSQYSHQKMGVEIVLTSVLPEV